VRICLADPDGPDTAERDRRRVLTEFRQPGPGVRWPGTSRYARAAAYRSGSTGPSSTTRSTAPTTSSWSASTPTASPAHARLSSICIRPKRTTWPQPISKASSASGSVPYSWSDLANRTSGFSLDSPEAKYAYVRAGKAAASQASAGASQQAEQPSCNGKASGHWPGSSGRIPTVSAMHSTIAPGFSGLLGGTRVAVRLSRPQATGGATSRWMPLLKPNVS
jgi:hypothetical protein